jgi:hypothetical protein
MGAKFCNKNKIKIIPRAAQKDRAGRVFGTKRKSKNSGLFKNFQDF